MGLLSLAIWLPIFAGAVLLAIGRDENANAARWMALVAAFASFIATLPLIGGLRHRHGGDAVRREAVLDRALQRALPPWRGRPVDVVRAAHRLHHGDRGDCRLGGDHRARQSVHGRVPDPLGPDGRRVLGARWPAVLRVLRGHADPDVHHHRRVGWAQARVRRVQVLPVHAGRLAAHAGGADLPVLQVRRQFRHPGLAQAAAHRAGADTAVLRVLPRFRRQGADVAGAHLAARRPRGSAHRRLGGAGGHHAEARRLRLPALFDADRARRQPRMGMVHHRAQPHRRDLHRPGRAGAAGHEEAGGLFVDRAHGLRHAGLLHLQRTRRVGRPGADGVPRLRVGRDVPVHRRALRPRPLPRDRLLRRRGEHHAQVRRFRRLLRDGQQRAAGHWRLRGRVDGDPRHRQGRLLAGLPGRDRADLRRRLQPVDGQAGAFRPDRQRQRTGADRHQRPRVRHAGRAGHRHALHGPLSRSPSPTSCTSRSPNCSSTWRSPSWSTEPWIPR